MDDEDGRCVDFIAIKAYKAHCAATLDAAVAIEDYAANGNYHYHEGAIEVYKAECAAAEAIKDYYRHLEETVKVDASNRAADLDANTSSPPACHNRQSLEDNFDAQSNLYLYGRFYWSYCKDDSSNDDNDGRRVDFIAIEAYEAHCAATLDAAVAIEDYTADGDYRYLLKKLSKRTKPNVLPPIALPPLITTWDNTVMLTPNP